MRGVELTGFEAFERSLSEQLSSVLEAAVTRGAEIVAFAARAEHPYTDRTGRLTASIEALPAVATGDLARGGVLAGMDYASFVEASHAYLAPAAQRVEGRVEHELDNILAAAIQRAR